jgi:oligoribonuclease NrnB/cAMP/cGMP phosphodiesterase (DHH superfamily)
MNYTQLNMSPDEVDYVIYHGGCVDGFSSAFSAWYYLNKKFPERKIEYFPAGFNQLPPDVTGKCVLICDFSYKKQIMESMLKVAKKIVVIDHHITAKEELETLSEKNKIFCMEKSGAYLTWTYFFGEEKVPKLIQYVQDNDIWTKKLPNTYEATAYIFTVPQKFEEYEKLLDDKYFDSCIDQGKGMILQNSNYIDNNLKYVAPKFVEIDSKYYFVGHINSTNLKSELGNKIMNYYKLIDFGAVYSSDDRNNSTVFSLRSTNNNVDVSKIAKLFGGGGHKCASGIKVNSIVNTIPCVLHDNYKLYSILNNIYVDLVNINGVKLNCVYLNSIHCKEQLAQYLLQDNSNINIDTKIPVQNVTRILQTLNNKIDLSFYDISIIWNYDGLKDETWMSLFINSYVSKENEKLIINKLLKCNNYTKNGVLHIFTMNGCCYKLPNLI